MSKSIIKNLGYILRVFVDLKTSNVCFWITCGLGALAASFALFCLETTYTPLDLWGYLAFGRLYWTGRSFPYQDVFAYVPTLKPWVYHEWLTGVVFYPLSIAAGAAGLQTLKYCLGLGTVALAYATARRRGASQAAATLLILMTGLILSCGCAPVRAQIFTFFFFSLVLYILERVKFSQRYGGLMWLPLILVPWANFHGGFVAGLGLIFLYALGEALAGRPFWPYVLTLVVAALATLINPYGWGYWSYLARALAMPRPEIREWNSHLAGLPRRKLSMASIAHSSRPDFVFVVRDAPERKVGTPRDPGRGSNPGARHQVGWLPSLLCPGTFRAVATSAYIL